MKMSLSRFFFILLIVLISALLAACGGGGETVPTPEPAATSTTEAEPEQVDTPVPADTPTPEGQGVSTLEDVQSAVIQIEAQGSFVDPEVGLQLNAAGRGSGFIIDPSGIAVTNNHVVTGAALLQVWVGGEDEPRNARVLGVSECSDLAVIDIDGEGYPTFQWYDGDINVGLDVYAAGFPLGDPEFTLTRGIVSKAETSGETNWASVDTVIEHDASINPGNSGGPLVDANGQVVGVNYAGASDVNQYFAIARDEAIRVIEQLRAGQDVNSIGVNGQAVSDGQGLSGIWVSSVKSGSPADRAGVRAGDIITTMEGLVLATDGTMADYCDILRTHNATDTMNIEVLRYATEEMLAGQLNGRELEMTFSFAQELEEEAQQEGIDEGTGEGTGAAATYTSYTTINDDSGTLTVEVPTEWADINGSAWTLDSDVVGVSVSAAPDLNGFNTTWTTPGIFFGASDTLIQEVDENGVLDLLDFSDSCTYDGRQPYEDALYTGFYDLWADCGGQDVLYVVLAATPQSRAYLILVQVQIVSDADLDALDHILASFIVNE
jgi:serine protease Do